MARPLGGWADKRRLGQERSEVTVQMQFFGVAYVGGNQVSEMGTSSFTVPSSITSKMAESAQINRPEVIRYRVVPEAEVFKTIARD